MLEIKKSQKETSLYIALIPGGPGLGSASFESLEILTTDYNLIYLESPATNKAVTYPELIQHFVNKIKLFSGNLILCGHSFGGIVAADMALNTDLDVKAFIGLNALFSEDSFQTIQKQYNKYKTPELEKANEEYSNSPSNESFKSYLSQYGKLYFTDDFIEAGNQMLKKDSVSFQTALGAYPEGRKRGEEIRDELAQSLIPKLIIGGEQDLLITPEIIENESKRGKLKKEIISGAGHFSHFEKPEMVSQTIKDFLNKEVKS